jgi:hypothetical protein
MNLSDSAITSAASGTLIKNAARQLTCSISQPPITGPIAVVMALNPDQVPIARPRSASSNVALMMARLPGTRNAAPIPCSARPIIRMRGEVATPQITDAAVKNATPKRKTFLRPNWSPSDPPTSIRAPRKSANASTTHWTSVMVAWRSACRAGSATLTTVPSMNVIAEPRIVATSVQRLLRAEVVIADAIQP